MIIVLHEHQIERMKQKLGPDFRDNDIFAELNRELVQNAILIAYYIERDTYKIIKSRISENDVVVSGDYIIKIIQKLMSMKSEISFNKET